MAFIIQPVTYDDASGIADCSMSAFYQDQHWALMWGSTPVEQITTDCAFRTPWKLVGERDRKRHLKVVEVRTGKIVGFGRFLLPHMHSQGLWEEAQIPEATEEQKAAFRKNFESVTINGRNRGMDYSMVSKLSPMLEAEDTRIKKKYGNSFLGTYYSVF
jgi:hypothetical protein